MTTTDTQTQSTIPDGPAVYVGTYGKYNGGSIAGKWVDLEQFAGDREGFFAHCAEIHKGEHDPEFMFQDYQCFPERFYCESGLLEALFDWLELNEQDREMLERYIDATGDDSADIRDAQDHYAGTYSTGADFAEAIAEELGLVPKDFPSWIAIDWEHTWEGGLRFDYSTSEHNGEIWFFHN